jgi:hypothetical protein
MSTRRAVALALATFAILPACEDKPAKVPGSVPAKHGPAPVSPGATTPAPAAPATPGAEAKAGQTVTVEGLTFGVPDGWTRATPANIMRLAELHAPGEAVAVFSSAGGDIPANIQRWSGQFQNAPATTTERTVAGLAVHTVDLAGTYSGMNEPAQNNYALHGAIIETGGQPVFVKMTGPADAVKAAIPAFDAMIDGMTK